MIYKPTTTSAKEFSDAGKLEEWIHLFLCGEGNNKPMSDGLKIHPRYYHAPTLYSLDKFKRVCGPEEDVKWVIDKNGFNQRVNKIMDYYQTNKWDMPPLIIGYNEKQYELNDGNHRFEALKRLGIKDYWVIIWETKNNEI